MENRQQHPYAPIYVSEFRHFLFGRFIYIMGIRMCGTVLGWWIYQLTNSKLALGFAGLSEFIPAFILALPAGHFIDKHEKRRTLLRAMMLFVMCILLFAILSSTAIASLLNKFTIAGLILLVIAFTGAIRAFSGPSFGSMIAQIVPKEMLPQAAAMSSATFLTASIIGHATGGFLIAFTGITYTFCIIAICCIAGIALIYKLKPQPVFEVKESTTWAGVLQGLKYVYRTKELFGAMSLDMFAVLFGGAVAMLPVYAQDILKIGPIGFGWLNAAADMGAIIMVIWLTINPLKGNQGKMLFRVVAGFGLCIILFGISKVFWLSFAALFVSGLLDGISVIIRSTILQLKTPNELRGRVMSVSSMFINSSNELGQFESGVAARLMGTVPSVVFGGIMTIAVTIATWIKAPSLRKMEY